MTLSPFLPSHSRLQALRSSYGRAMLPSLQRITRLRCDLLQQAEMHLKLCVERGPEDADGNAPVFLDFANYYKFVSSFFVLFCSLTFVQRCSLIVELHPELATTRIRLTFDGRVCSEFSFLTPSTAHCAACMCRRHHYAHGVFLVRRRW